MCGKNVVILSNIFGFYNYNNMLPNFQIAGDKVIARNSKKIKYECNQQFFLKKNLHFAVNAS